MHEEHERERGQSTRSSEVIHMEGVQEWLSPLLYYWFYVTLDSCTDTDSKQNRQQKRFKLSTIVNPRLHH